MSGIIGFLTAYWPYILAYPFAGYTLGKISNKLFVDDTPSEKLNFLQKIPRMVFFPLSYHGWNERNERHLKYDDLWEDSMRRFSLRAFAKRNDDLYCKILTTFWPLSAMCFVTGLLETSFFITANGIEKIVRNGVCGIIKLTAKLPEKSYALLQNETRQIKLLALGKNQDIKTVISQMEEFKDTYLEVEKSKIIAEQKTIEDRLQVINKNFYGWKILTQLTRNTDTTARINPILKSLAKEIDALAAKKSNLCQLEEKLNASEISLSESVEILWRCLSTIPLGIPVYADGPQLIKGDYMATLASDTISQAETEMARIKDEINKFGNGGE